MTSAPEQTKPEQDWIAGALEQAWAEADTRTGSAQDHLRIAGRYVNVRYASAALRDLLGRATRHLRCEPEGSPALTIDCWSAPGPSPSPPAHWPANGTVLVDDDAVVVNWDGLDGTLRAYDRTSRHAWTRFGFPDGAATWEAASPFRRIFHWWAADCSLQFTHAAAVGRADGGVLLVGPSGSGKSTTSLACLTAGLDFAGDDSCFIESGDTPRVYGLYVSAKGDDRASGLLPAWTDEFAGSQLRVEGESIIFADRIRPDGISAGFPLRGVVVLRRSKDPVSRLSPIGASAALRGLAPSTLMQVHGGDRAGGLARMAAIVVGLPAWELRLGPDPAAAAELITKLIDGGAAPT